MLEQIKKFVASIPKTIEIFLDSNAFASLGGVASLHTNHVYIIFPKMALGGEIYEHDNAVVEETLNNR